MAVQTLLRLNRARPDKNETFILDFFNDVGTIRDSFSDYYTTTILSDETDPNKLNDIISELETHQIYTGYHIETVVNKFIGGAGLPELQPYLDECARGYDELDEDGQVSFKSNAKLFTRTY